MSSRRRLRGDSDGRVPESNVNDIWMLASGPTAVEGGNSESKSDLDSPEGGTGHDSKAGVTPIKQHETYTLFVGQKQSGKSTLITAFHNPTKEDTPKPTVALEYLFARRSTATNKPKDVAHIWELGGGLTLSNLISVPIAPLTIRKAVVAIVVDLSQPNNLVHSLSQWLQILRIRGDECLSDIRATDPALADAINRAAASRFQEDHPDKMAVRPLPMSTLIVANKLDVFREQDQVQKKAVFQMLRFVAHLHGATLLTVGAKDKTSQNNLRTHLTSLLFGGSGGKASRKEVALEKPMAIPAGSDSFEDILKAGLPPTKMCSLSTADFIDSRSGRATEDSLPNWGRVLEDFFGAAAPGEEDVPASATQGKIDIVSVFM